MSKDVHIYNNNNNNRFMALCPGLPGELVAEETFTHHCQDLLPHGQFAPWTFCPLYGRFALCMDVLPHGRFAQRLFTPCEMFKLHA